MIRAETLWGTKAKFGYLLIAAIVLLFTLLGSKEIWTQEHRWADIVSGMFYRHDFLHPYLGETRYYDKPLLSYWLIALFAQVTGSLSTWALRFPSALAGLLAVVSIVQLGTTLKDKQLGLLSGWLLLTTFYFVFWARTSSADMLNLAGSLFAISWYFKKRDHAGVFDYSIFFLIVALTSLCKGLIGAIIPFIAVATDMWLENSWKKHLRLSLIISIVPAAIIYFLPFFASSYFDGQSYGQSGLYLVYRENILRYFQPFDHQGPIYTYFIYLPIYLMPWTILFIPALFVLRKRYKSLTLESRWIMWTLFFLFLFFTLSGSRRSYYVLPIVPFAILFTADWLSTTKRLLNHAWAVAAAFFILFVAIDLLPGWYYSQVGVDKFANELKTEAAQIKPWQDWNVVMLDAESKLNFYLQLPPSVKHYYIQGLRAKQTTASLAMSWPILTNKPANTIFITRKLYVPLIQHYFVGYKLVTLPEKLTMLQKHAVNVPVAFVPDTK